MFTLPKFNVVPENGWLGKTFLLGRCSNFSGATLIFEGVSGVSIVSWPKLLHLEEWNREDFRYQSPIVLFRSFLSPWRHFHPPAIAGGAVTCATEERKTEQFLSINLVFVGFIQDISGRIHFWPLILRCPRVFYRATEISGMFTLEGRHEYLFNRMLACSNAGFMPLMSQQMAISLNKGVEGAQTPMHGRYDALYPLSSRLISHRFRWTFDKRW